MNVCKDWLVPNQDNVSECSDMYIRRLLFQLANTIKKITKRDGLEKSGHHHPNPRSIALDGSTLTIALPMRVFGEHF
jgi:hypothetical protein